MHDEARRFCSKYSSPEGGFALDIGGRNVNGHVRDLWPNMKWTVLDQTPLDPTSMFVGDEYIVADAATWSPDRQYNLVICTEVLEHDPAWMQICDTAFHACAQFASFIITCAGPGRPPHSTIDGAELRFNETYQNIDPFVLANTLKRRSFAHVMVSYDPHACDTYAHAIKL